MCKFFIENQLVMKVAVKYFDKLNYFNWDSPYLRTP